MSANNGVLSHDINYLWYDHYQLGGNTLGRSNNGLAYTLGENVVRVGFKYGQAIAHGNPIVMFTPTSHGWVVQAMHQVSPACRSLPAAH